MSISGEFNTKMIDELAIFCDAIKFSKKYILTNIIEKDIVLAVKNVEEKI